MREGKKPVLFTQPTMTFYIINRENRTRQSRRADLEHLHSMYKKESNPEERKKIKHTAEKIQKENKSVRSMREQLIKAHRNQDTKKKKEIHDYIKNKSKYKNE